MSKPILTVSISTLDNKKGTVQAVVDSGSFYTLLREDKVPSRKGMVHLTEPKPFRAAAKGSQLNAVAEVPLVITLANKMIDETAFVSPDLAQEMLIGAKTMQAWDISIINKNGKTIVRVGRDRRDPDLTEVDEGNFRKEPWPTKKS